MDHLSPKGKRVLIRVDFNVPFDEAGDVSDDTRIRSALPTIQNLLDRGAAVILTSHLGRPQKHLRDDGTIDTDRFSLRNILKTLEDVVGQPVQFCDQFVGSRARNACFQLNAGEILLLENTRFEAGEKKGDESLAKELASYAEIYVNDAFGTAHRAHVSTTKVAHYFSESERAFGLLMEKEIQAATKALNSAERPFVAIVGGAKVSDKIELIDRLIYLTDSILIGGAMAYTFLIAQGGKVGNSLVEEDKIELAQDLLAKAKENHCRLILPVDSVVADHFAVNAAHRVQESKSIDDGWMGLDIGPRARQAYGRQIMRAKTIIWNGPMGVFEMELFSKGTSSVAQSVAKATEKGAYSLVGGGDSVAAINRLGLADKVSHVSTGGGAMLEFLEGRELPGIEAIAD